MSIPGRRRADRAEVNRQLHARGRRGSSIETSRRGDCVGNLVWFGWDGTYLRFTQTTPQQRARNLERDPRIAVSIVDPTNPYRRLEIRGRAVAFEPDPELAFINGMAKKYLGQDTYPWHNPGDTWVVVVVEPKHTTQMG